MAYPSAKRAPASRRRTSLWASLPGRRADWPELRSPPNHHLRHQGLSEGGCIARASPAEELRRQPQSSQQARDAYRLLERGFDLPGGACRVVSRPCSWPGDATLAALTKGLSGHVAGVEEPRPRMDQLEGPLRQLQVAGAVLLDPAPPCLTIEDVVQGVTLRLQPTQLVGWACPVRTDT